MEKKPWFDELRLGNALPPWLARVKGDGRNITVPVRFPLRNILQGSFYYPASGVDGRPVQFLAGFCHSFIYADYGISQEELKRQIGSKRSAFKGYRLIGSRSVSEEELAPNGWSPRLPRLDRLPARAPFDNMKPYARWFVFERNKGKSNKQIGPQRFSFLFICGDGVATYQALFHANKKAPKVLAIIQPGTGFGGNWTDFTKPGDIFWRTVMDPPAGCPTPRYLVHGGYGVGYENACWPEFSERLGYFQVETGNGMWARQRAMRQSRLA